MAIVNIIDNGSNVDIFENGIPITIGKNRADFSRSSGDYLVLTSDSGGKVRTWKFNLINDTISIDSVLFAGSLDDLHDALKGICFS